MEIYELENRLKENADALRSTMRVPDDIIETIREEESEAMNKKSVFKGVGLTLAGVAAAFVLLLNFIPNLAYAAQDIPVISGIVRVVTFGRYEVSRDGFEANVVTPQIEGLLNKELQDKLNNEFKEYSQIVIAAFEKDIKALEKEYGNDFHLGVDANYTVRTDNEDVLAIDTYIVNTVASSSTKHCFYNINKKTGELLELKALFKENADYVTPISEYIISEMKSQNEDGVGNFWIGNEGTFDGFEKIKENQNFFINNSGNIVICFDKYEVAPGAWGCPEFEIPDEVVADIIK